MPRIRCATIVNAPVERVFEACDDPDAWILDASGFTRVGEVRRTEQRTGDSFTAVRMGGRHNQNFVCTEYQKPNRIGFEFRGIAFGAMRFSLTAQGSGTHLTLDIEYEPSGGPLARAADKFVFRRINERNARRMVANVKTLCEVPAG